MKKAHFDTNCKGFVRGDNTCIGIVTNSYGGRKMVALRLNLYFWLARTIFNLILILR